MFANILAKVAAYGKLNFTVPKLTPEQSKLQRVRN
jgi:hypothetical protein